MPANDPTNGGIFAVPKALEKALGLIDPNSQEVDGAVGLNDGINWNPDFNSPPGPGQSDAFGALEHEVSEVLGRIGIIGAHPAPDGQALYGPMDLYRYTGPGQLDPSAPAGYFSLVGNSDQQDFNNPQIHPGDAADWYYNYQGDAFGSITPGVKEAFTETDLLVMRALGYTAPTDAIVNG